MNAGRSIKVPELVLSTLLLSIKPILVKNVFFAKKAQLLNFVTLKMGVALHFLMQLTNHKSQWSDFGVMC